MITLTNLGLQNASNIFVPYGSIQFILNTNATVVAAPYGFVSAAIPVVFQLDGNGNILPNAPAAAAQLYSNAELYPQTSEGLGTYYLVTCFDQNGAILNPTPMWWQFTQAANSTVNISEMIPFSTVGGNVIFYPTSFTIPAPTVSSLGGVYANAGTAHQWVYSINTDGTVTTTQPSFSDISGTISSSQLPSGLTFGATTFSGLITAQANIQLGVAGTTSGVVTMEGSTSGACTITAPATAGTSTNPFAFSNAIQIPSGTVYLISTDTGISRDSAGVFDFGNGTAANKSGSINCAAITATSLITAKANIQLGVAGSTSGVVTMEGSTSGSCTVTAPAIAGTTTNPIVFSNAIQAPSIVLTGLITEYDGLTTAGLGVPPILANVSAVTQSYTVFNSATPVNLLASAPAGRYRASIYLVITTTFVTNTEVTITIGWTDEKQAQTYVLTTSALTAGTYAAGTITLSSAASDAITYTPGVTGSAATAGAASFYIVLERLV